jgi:ribosome biogenesis GTP-binding protein YsxC/EngB
MAAIAHLQGIFLMPHTLRVALVQAVLPTVLPPSRFASTYQKSPRQLSSADDEVRQRSSHEESARSHKGDGNPSKSDADTNAANLKHASKFFQLAPAKLLYSTGSLDHNRYRNSHVPEICIIGKSNAGKSTLINRLCGQHIARESAKPGYTRMMNVYSIGPPMDLPPSTELASDEERPTGSIMLVDTPGYGYASKAEWGSIILRYLETRPMLRGVIFTFPANVDWTDRDALALRTVLHRSWRTVPVLTKLDKIWRKEDKWQAQATDILKKVDSVGRRALGPQASWRPTLYLTGEGLKWDLAGDTPALWRHTMDTPPKLVGVSKKPSLLNEQDIGLATIRLTMMRMAKLMEDEELEMEAEQSSPTEEGKLRAPDPPRENWTGKIVPFDQIMYKPKTPREPSW